jgi:UDP-GlcNAc:undecaprenyl-phosphate GlcNAc-1-phosphate transferase
MITFFICTILLNLSIFFFQDKLDKFVNIYDKPDKIRKFHKGSIPLTGGVLIFINLFFFIICDFFLEKKFFFFQDFFNYNRIYYSFVFGLVSFFLLGLLDDKISISANLKLIIQILILFIVLLLDPNLKIEYIKFSFFDKKIYLNEFSLIFSILCFLLFINAFNMFDGINGQSGIYAIINFLIFYLLLDKLIFLLIIFIMVIFLCKNFKNKIFLGNSGSYLISFLISFYYVKFYNTEIINEADFIGLIMFIPGLDLLRLFFFRIYKGKNPFTPDRNHLHHILLRKFNYKLSFFLLFFLIGFPLIINYFFHAIFLIIILTTFSYALLLIIIRKFKNKY